MTDIENLPIEGEETEEMQPIVLTDLETGKDIKVDILEVIEHNGKTYYVMQEVGNESDEYGILIAEEEDGMLNFTEIEDDEEFDTIADIFENMYFDAVDYDDGEGDGN